MNTNKCPVKTPRKNGSDICSDEEEERDWQIKQEF